MSIIRYNANDFVPTSFSNLVDRFFSESIARSGGSSFVPKVDIIENENSFEIHFAVPGLNKEDFNIELKDNYLTVSGERKLSNEKKEKNFHSIETSYGDKGILELTIPKDEKKTLKQTIKVN